MWILIDSASVSISESLQVDVSILLLALNTVAVVSVPDNWMTATCLILFVYILQNIS